MSPLKFKLINNIERQHFFFLFVRVWFRRHDMLLLIVTDGSYIPFVYIYLIFRWVGRDLLLTLLPCS